MRITYEKDSKLICSEKFFEFVYCYVHIYVACELVAVWFCAASSSAHFGVPCAMSIYYFISTLINMYVVENVDARLLVLEFVQHCV